MPPTSIERQAYEHLQLWQPVAKILPAEKLCEPGPGFKLFSFLYLKTWQLYQQLPLRKNGENPFLHPVNVVLYLRKARITDPATLAAGLIHDYVEEAVDLFKRRQKVPDTPAGIARLDRHEAQVFRQLQRELQEYSQKEGIAEKLGAEILAAVRLLTRHKRHFYYRSIAGIFNCPDRVLKERAIQVKLADRMHNAQCLECFDEGGQIYACFKSLFVLNNAKKFLIDCYGNDYLLGKKYSPTEKLFNKCSRATYHAFRRISHLCNNKGVHRITTLLQLAFKKFTLEKEGLWLVTSIDENEAHPLRLYQGIVRKYDTRMHHEFKRYAELQRKELDYCRKFFADYRFSPAQLQAVIWYKDAYALKEVIACLLYLPDYYVQRFICAELTGKGRIKE